MAGVRPALDVGQRLPLERAEVPKLLVGAAAILVEDEVAADLGQSTRSEEVAH